MLSGNEAAAVATTAAFTVTVTLPRSGAVLRISVDSDVATNQEIEITSITIGGKPYFIRNGTAVATWRQFQNVADSRWHQLAEAMRTGATGAVVVAGINTNGANSDIKVLVEYV